MYAMVFSAGEVIFFFSVRKQECCLLSGKSWQFAGSTSVLKCDDNAQVLVDVIDSDRQFPYNFHTNPQAISLNVSLYTQVEQKVWCRWCQQGLF